MLQMRATATYDDVNLILKLYELRREERMRRAREWFARHFKAATLEDLQRLCPTGSEEDSFFRMVTSYWEMVASFIAGGVLDCELFFHSHRELLLVWERVKELTPKAREQAKDPHLLKNLEAVAKTYIAWIEKRSPEAYPVWSERIRKTAR